MIHNNEKDIRTKNYKIKIGEIEYIDNAPHINVKKGKNRDIISLNDIASQLYGRNVVCEVKIE